MKARSKDVEYARPGVKFVMSWMVLIPSRSRVFEVYAEMATGTVSKLSLRFSAVTTISAIALSSPGEAALAAAGAGAGAGVGSAKAASENATDTAPESNSATVLVVIFLIPLETVISRPFVH